MTGSAVRAATPDDLAAVSAVLTAAFHDDPVMSWAFPDPDTRRRRLSALWDFLAGEAYLPRGASTVAPRDAGAVGGPTAADGAALWLAPGDELDDAFWEERAAPFVAALEADLERLGEVSALMREHHPAHPHWYLLAIGCHPDLHGRGLGSALLAHALVRCDESGAPAYLEASSLRSRLLYERFGFEVIASFAPEGGPPLWAMWREPGRPA
jgi:ribosomal protein S18 acetylase RimI-like enzyme